MNTLKFAKKVIRFRGATSYRKVEGITGVGFATVHRVENGKKPDVDAFLKLCLWMKCNPFHFMDRCGTCGPCLALARGGKEVQCRYVA